MWEDNVELGRSQTTVWRMRIACWITKATDTFLDYVMVFFFTATMVARTCLTITSYVHCLSCVSRFSSTLERYGAVRSSSHRVSFFLSHPVK